MTKWLIGLCAIVVSGVLAMEDAEARRLGGGRSTGVQRSVPNNPPAATPARPGQQQAAPNQAANQGASAQPSGLSRWMPMLGGLALGGLLGYLFAGNGLGGILLLALLAIAAFAVFRMLSRRRETPQRVQYAGLGQETVVAPPASPATGMVKQSAAGLPAGFDAASFLRGAKMNFVKLQLANDLGQVDDLREFTTDEMFEALKSEIAERGSERQQTDVEGLHAELLEVATEGERHWASVRFSGSVRETPGAPPVDF